MPKSQYQPYWTARWLRFKTSDRPCPCGHALALPSNTAAKSQSRQAAAPINERRRSGFIVRSPGNGIEARNTYDFLGAVSGMAAFGVRRTIADVQPEGPSTEADPMQTFASIIRNGRN